MGAELYLVTYSHESKDTVQESWNLQVEDDSYESGSGAYAGNATSLGRRIDWRNGMLASERDAEQFISENQQKWDGPMACSFYLPAENSSQKQASIAKAKERLIAKQTKKYDFMLQSLNSFRNRKAALVGCKCCGSKLSLEHISKELKDGRVGQFLTTYPTLPLCAVCRTPLYSASTMERIKKLTLSVEEAKKALDESQKPTPSKSIGWVVGGWASC
jgi:hypothetical protein